MREPLGSLDARLESEPKAGETLKYAPQASGCMPIQADVLIPDQLLICLQISHIFLPLSGALRLHSTVFLINNWADDYV